MRLTYTTIKQQHFRNIGKANQFGDATLLADFQFSLGTRYQMIWGALSEYISQDTLTTSTVASQQYYYYPVGTVGVDSATILIGSMRYTLTPIYSQYTWNQLNAMQIQPTAIPQFIFPRRDDYGVWPIPTAAYTLELNRFLRDRNMLIDDYSIGTVALTAGSTTITGTSTVWTAAMVGRWFTINDPTAVGQGYWYRIGSWTSATSMELETDWAGSTASGITYLVGESPELPEDAHTLLPAGTAADYYAGLRNSNTSATWWNNVFYTGDGNNPIRDQDSKNVMGGLIGLIKKYKDRERDNIVIRQPGVISPTYKVWAQTIT